MIHEPYELRQLENEFKKLKPKAYQDGDKLYFTCENEHYKQSIGEISQWMFDKYKVERLKIRAKLAFYYLLQKEKKLKICDCGNLIFNPKPWMNICNDCIRKDKE